MTSSADREVARMFDGISPTYDLLNHILSLGIDRRWRTLAAKHLHLWPGQRVLDCGAGTGDMALAALRREESAEIVLLDPARRMLEIADGKAGMVPPSCFRLVCGVAEALPFADRTFDRFMVAFGIRNFADLDSGIRELRRVLKPDGRGVILEFTPDRSRIIDRLFRGYMKRVMIPLGARISRQPDAYRYLTRTMQNFLPSHELLRVFSSAGFRCVENRPLAMGIARLLVLVRA